MDYRLIDKMIEIYSKYKDVDYFSNVHPPTFPDGFDIEIFSFKVLKNLILTQKKDMRKNMLLLTFGITQNYLIPKIIV